MSVLLEGEIVLPSNPNCVEFTASAAGLLAARPWAAVQQIAVLALEAFHAHSGIDCVVWFGRRVTLDRQNRPTGQVPMMFVFDGPATREQVGALENAMRRAPVRFSAASIAPVPQAAFPSLVAKSGKIYQVWVPSDRGPHAMWLELDGDDVNILGTTPEDAKAQQFARKRHILGVTAPLHEQDIHLEKLKLAFARRVSEQIVRADGVVQIGEQEFLRNVFPADLLNRYGLDDAPTLQALYEEALAELPIALGHHEKLALIGLFFAACHSDGQLAAREMKVLKQAATVLGLAGPEVVEYLARIW